MALPPIVSGFALLILLGDTNFGHFLSNMGLKFIFSVKGIILAQFFINFPYMIRVLRSTIADINPRLEFVGRTLGCSQWQAHDLTQIIPGVFKGRRFKKGYIVKYEDIPVLLSMGKEHLYVLELGEDDVYEDDAAWRIALAAAGENIELVKKGEGKVELTAACKGVLKIESVKLADLIEHDEVMFASICQNQVVQKGQAVAGTRVIPLYVKKDMVEESEQIKNIISVLPLKRARVGLVTTGNEIYYGRIKDAFGDVLRDKFSTLGSKVVKQLFSTDEDEMIAACIKELLEEGIDLIAVTGGMSVDPDDRTPAGIRRVGAEIITYGAPVLPGAMFLLGYIGEIPIVGLPGCVMYYKASVFDLIIPRILAGEKISRRDIKALAQGGMCRGCQICTYPNCGFGKAY